MEFTEVVSAHVAFPVLGVLVCAVLVFAFGFKSPVQPPSFDFDDERNKGQRRSRKSTKPKPQTNGHVIAVVTEEAPKPSSPKPKLTSKATKHDGKSGKAEQGTPKADSKKDKAKRGTKEDAKSKDDKPATLAKTKMTLEDDGEWEVQRSRKDKKQKPKEETGKKSDSNDDKNKPSSDEGEGSYAAAESKTKRKKKTSKETQKTKQTEEVKTEPYKGEGKNAVAAAVNTSKPVELVIAKVETNAQQAVSEEFETAQNKKNKKKKDKKPSTQDIPDGSASSISKQHEPTPAALASTPAVVPTSAPAPVPQNTKASVKEEPSIEADAKVPRSPKKKKGKDSGANASAASQAPKEEVQVVAEAKPVEPNKSTDMPKAKKPTEKGKTAASEPAQPEVVAPAVEMQKASETHSTPVTFDELGGSSDSWTEAPKSKKKRPRREN